MKSISFTLLALSAFFVPANAEPCAAEVSAFKLIEAPHKIADKSEGSEVALLQKRIAALSSDYAVAVSEKTWSDPAWRAVAEKLAKQRIGENGKPIVFSSFIGLKDALRERGTRMLAIVASPEEIDPRFISQIHILTRKLDDDPFGDCIWGVITGENSAAAEKLFTFDGNAKSGILRIDNYLASTNFRSPRAKKSFCITDFGAMTFREGDSGKWTDGRIPANDGGAQKLFVEKWMTMLPELIVSSSHATQYNLEMPWGKGAIVAADGKFWALGERDFRRYVPMMSRMNRDAAAFRAYNETAKMTQIPFPPADKKCVWIAAGNCLFGDVNKSQYSMAVTALSHYNAMQVVGYTVTSWYGAGGWGTLGAFYNSPAGTGLSEAWYLNNQAVIDQLMNAKKGSVDWQGCNYDLNVVALYGDPAFHAYIGEKTAQAPWRVDEPSGENALRITTQGDHCGPFAYWFSSRRNFKKASLKIGERKEPLSKENAFFSNDFIWLRKLELKDGASAEIIFE